jgi:hypothetical protein
MTLAGEDIEINWRSVSFVMSLYLRHQYIERHSGIIPEAYKTQ